MTDVGSVPDFINTLQNTKQQRLLSEVTIGTNVARLSKTVEPSRIVTVAEVKAWSRVDNDDEDTLIEAMIDAATFMAENWTGSAFGTQTWLMAFDRQPLGRILTIPRPPLQSVTLVESSIDDGTATTFDASNYVVETRSKILQGRIALLDSKTWPTDLRIIDALRITFVCGYATVPEQIKAGVKSLVAVLFENREEIDMKDKLTEEARTYLRPFKVIKF